ncbi:F-box/FBD/LRR-repeat protein At5g53840 [Linum grandiflorum]
MMNTEPDESTAAGEDQISKLPDEILHRILRCLGTCDYEYEARTTVLSKRWRSLWQSYPIVGYSNRDVPGGDASISAALQNFGRCTIERFSRDKALGMEALKLFAALKDVESNLLVRRLMKLAANRKAEEVDVELSSAKNPSFLYLPFRLLSDCTNAQTLRLKKLTITGNINDLDLFPNSLRFLDLCEVNFSDEQLCGKLLASSPLLETLRLQSILQLKKLKIGNANLKRIVLHGCRNLEEIEIKAPLLQDLSLRGIGNVVGIELDTPRLEILAIRGSKNSTMMRTLISNSNLRSLKSLTLDGSSVTDLNLSAPKLKRFTLRVQHTARRIEFDAGSCDLEQFCLHSRGNFPGKLKKCVIRNAAATSCRWKAEFDLRHSCAIHQWFVDFKSFITRFTQFQTVTISWPFHNKVEFRENEVDHATSPTSIEHLTIKMPMRSNVDQATFLDGALWACRPRYLTLIHDDDDDTGCAGKIVLAFLSGYLRKFLVKKKNKEELLHKRKNWQFQLKDVKNITGDIGSSIREVSKKSVTLVKDRYQVSMVLTWN